MRIFVLLFVFFLLLSSTVQAEPDKCTCTAKSFDTRWNDSAAVFLGTVKSIKTVEKYVEYGNDDLPVEVTLSVDDAYKGTETGEDFVLHTSLTRGTCTGHPFEEGKKYLLFVYRREAETFEYWSLYDFPSGTYDVGGLCGGTKGIKDAETAVDMREIMKRIRLTPKKEDGFLKNLMKD